MESRKLKPFALPRRVVRRDRRQPDPSSFAYRTSWTTGRPAKSPIGACFVRDRRLAEPPGSWAEELQGFNAIGMGHA